MNVIGNRGFSPSLIMVLISLIVCVLFSSHLGTADQSDNVQFQLPKLFDWAHYKLAFDKVYPNIRDEIARNKLFVANALRTFVHNIAFKIGKMSYFLKVNQFSDFTADELRQLSAGFSNDALPVAPSIVDNNSGHEDVDDEPTIGLDLAALQQELARVIEQKQPGYEILASELRVKIDGHPERKRGDATVDREFGSTSGGPAPKESYKFVRRVPSTNAKYQPVEMVSQSTAERSERDNNRLAIDMVVNDFVNVFNQMPQVKFVREQLDKVFGVNEANTKNSKQTQIEVDRSLQAINKQKNHRKDEVFVDWRTSNCLTIPKNQNYCRACYAFATMAMLEWAHCQQTGKLVPFSEQYMIDCGKHVGLYGCKGGSMAGMAKFIMDWGVELRYNYPFLAKESMCPYDKNDWDRAGFLKPVVKSFTMEQNIAKWPKLLKENGPFIVIIMQPKDFHFYGGKVHKGHNCKESNGIHAMLLVGHGIEDGQEYWLLRNSHGHDWGELGHFKLARYATTNCYFQANLAKVDFMEKVPSIDKQKLSAGDEAYDRKLTPSGAYLEGLFKGFGPYQLERAEYLAYNGQTKR